MGNLLSPWHMLILMVIALLIFGRRLPEVGRNLGRGIVEFKKGLKDVSDSVDDASRQTTRSEPLPPRTEAGPQVQPPRDAQGQEVRVSRNDAVQ